MPRNSKSFSSLVPLLLLAAVLGSFAQSSGDTVVLHATEAAKILPPAVFFRGQSAPIQARNSAGLKFPDGTFTLATLVDNSGYSSAVQQKYQAYFITEVKLDIGGHILAPGAYGVGFVEDKFVVMDIGDNDLFSAAATHDTKITRPTPLQILPDETPGHFRLYEGRSYVVIARAGKG